jgi:hypothetical protein
MGSNMTKRFKIDPDLTCPELAGYKLPEVERRQEDEMKVESEKYGFRVPYNGSNEFYDKDAIKHFEAGYTKAREKYQFTEEDMKYIFECGRNYQNNAEVTFKVSIQSLRTPRHPIAIDVEMVESPSYNAIRMQDKNDCFAYFIPATNPDGTVKGVYVYE